MKDLSILVWLTQAGLSLAAPLAGFVLLGVWLRDAQGWGDWALWAGLVLGILTGAEGLRHSLKTLNRMAGGGGKQPPPPTAFNDHD